MKTYKAVILSIWLLLSVVNLLASMSAYSGGYALALLALAGAGFWFNYAYANGQWPEMSFWKACGIVLALAAVSVYVVAISFAEQYQRGIGEMLSLMMERTPQIFIQPIILTPLSLWIWRWLFKEPRLARLAAAALPVAEFSEGESK